MNYLEYCKKVRGAWPSVECLADLSFVLYYVPDVDCLQRKRYFTWDERADVTQELSHVFRYFSLRDSFLKAVRESRIRGKKHWKKRRWKLPEKGKVKVKVVSEEDMLIAKNNLEYAVKWAAKNQDLSTFDIYLEAYKVLPHSSSSKTKIFKEFVDKVEKMK